MSTPLSTESYMALAVQGAKGTAATTGFISTRAQQSQFFPVFQYSDAGPEHFWGQDQLPVTLRSPAYITTYLTTVQLAARLYPESIGHILTGLGLKATSTKSPGSGGVDDDYEHVFKITTRDLAKWLTVLSGIGAGAAQFERRGTDTRFESLRLMLGPKGSAWQAQGVGIEEDDAVGTETIAAEDSTPLQARPGSATVVIDGWTLTSQMLGLQWNVANPLNKQENPLFSDTLNDLPQQGIASGGQLMGIDVSQAFYNRMTRGGAAGTAPVYTLPSGSVTFSVRSEGNIPSCSVPFSLTVACTNAEMRMQQIGSSGMNLVRCALGWRAVTTDEDVLTVTLVNTVAAY